MRLHLKPELIEYSLFYLGVSSSTIALYLKNTPLGILGLAIMAYPILGMSLSKTIYSPDFQRKTAWVLLALSLMEALTGFGAGPTTASIVYYATFGLLNRGLSLQLHIILIAPLAFFFILHIASGIGMALIRRRITWQPLYNYVIPAVLILAFSAVMYMYSELIIP
ncbi:hypothetical protein [Caldivirga maquilingensis]|uniref:Uncharacterized protein n=1 Tax=Caldivirga maquilingensis (strain ATCC 700844 / DSM 13496 / JCM 10307 / IC-167) TaxID=397948 RepID=A8M986_CALMQ|nr:hypothetical protein [Caldivirga maquilingensis]ABW02305.1 conserved hypothetical protein [Caldivirga maquilingensis IC-167]